MQPELKAKIIDSVNLYKQGSGKPLEIAIQTGNDSVYEAILTASNIPPELLERLFLIKEQNGFSLESVIRQPNLPERLKRYILSSSSDAQIKLLLKHHPESIETEWFVQFITNPSVQAAIKVEDIEPEQIVKMKPAVVEVLLSSNMNLLSIYQSMLTFHDNPVIRLKSVDILDNKGGGLKSLATASLAINAVRRSENRAEVLEKINNISIIITRLGFNSK